MQDTYEVKVTRQAREQMQEIVHYISRTLMAPDAAHNLLDQLEKSVYSLSQMPGRMPVVNEEPWRSEEVRIMKVKNFLVYFWIDKEGFKVQVTAVIYEKRDQVQQLLNMDME